MFLSLTAPPISAEFRNVLQTRCNAAAPRPNGIRNIVWKRCPCLQEIPYSIVKRVGISQKMPQSWQCTIVRPFDEKGCTHDPAHFRPISLSNYDRKIFFVLPGNVIQKHMTKKLLFRLFLYPKGFSYQVFLDSWNTQHSWQKPSEVHDKIKDQYVSPGSTSETLSAVYDTPSSFLQSNITNSKSLFFR